MFAVASNGWHHSRGNMFIKGLLIASLLQPPAPMRIVYIYNIAEQDSLEIIINKNNKTIHHKNYRLTQEMPDSTPTVGMGTKQDNIEIIMRGYKKDLYCFPHVDKLTYPDFRISYGLNFECVRLKM